MCISYFNAVKSFILQYFFLKNVHPLNFFKLSSLIIKFAGQKNKKTLNYYGFDIEILNKISH